MRLIAIPLGELERDQVVAVLERHFAGAHVEWLDRHELRRAPFATLATLWGTRFDAAVLVAADLGSPRLRLTSLLLGLPRAGQRWRLDVHGNREKFDVASHLGTNALPVLRHLLAITAARALGEPILQVIDAALRPSHPHPSPLPEGEGTVRRILYLRSQLWLGLEGGGSVAHTAGVIGGLQQAGVEVQVASSDRLPGVAAPTVVLPPETWFDGPLRDLEDLAYNVAFALGALRAARRFRPRVIYQRHTAYNISGALISRLLHTRLVLEFNSSELWKGCYWGGLHLPKSAALVERINLRAADRVVVVSRVLRDELVAKGLPTDRVLVNPNAVDTERFRPDVDGTAVRAQLGLEQNQVIIGFSGTFGRWHGIPTLAAALPRVLQARLDARWLLIGDGPLRPLVEATIKEHAIDDRVIKAGLVPHAEMPAYLAACDILVSPHGRQADGGEFFGSPTKLFEYMASGRGIVASRVGQIADVLHHEHSALLVPPDDPEALCGAIVRLVDDAQLRQRLGAQARRDAEECHTWRQNAERVLAALRES